jgi:hypothetical protein
MIRTFWISAVLGAALAAAACGRHGGTTEGGQRTQVAKIVFLDRLDGNADAKARLDGIWSEVQAALEGWPEVNVERIHIDAEPRQSSKFLEMRSVDKPPGLFFLDADGALLEMVEGEIRANQIREILLRD